MIFQFMITPHKGESFVKKIKANDEHMARRAILLNCLKEKIFIKKIQIAETC